MVKYRQDLDRTFSALSDHTRRAVLQRLAASPCPIAELANDHSMTVAGMLKHIKVLENAGLIRSLKHGRRRICEMQPESCNSAREWLESYRNRWNNRFESLAGYLSELENSQELA